MSLTRGDAHANSRWWLTSRRQSLYSEKANSDRTSIQYALDYSSFWKMKVLQTKSIQTLVFDPVGSKGRLCACPFLETWRALLCGEVLVWAPAGGDLERFWLTEELKYHFSMGDTSAPYVLRLIAVSPQSQVDMWSRQVRGHAVMGAWRINRCQGTPWSEELDGKELHGAAGGDLEPRESAVSSTSSTRTRHQLHKHL